MEIPRDRFTVITGVSGSGKSTLAFDILFNEGQRRYLESLNAYARQFVQPAARPDVDAIFGIPPTVAIEQRTSRGGRKSTVATLTEIYHFLRLLYVKLGTQYCPDCDVAIEPQSPASIAARLLRDYRGRRITLLAPLIVARKGYYTDLAKWAAKKGFRAPARRRGAPAHRALAAPVALPRAHASSCRWRRSTSACGTRRHCAAASTRALDFGKGVVHVLGPKGSRVTVFSTRRACPDCGRSFARARPAPVLLQLQARLVRGLLRHRACRWPASMPSRAARSAGGTSGTRVRPHPAASCHGERLNPIALAVRFRERSIAALAAEPVSAALEFFGKLRLGTREREIARDLLAEIRARLKFLERVGLGYLQLDRAAPTLSGGEAQRIRLAAQLGSNLQGVCYVLDEPTIGLHPRDNAILLDSLAELAGHRNTLVVVEHDEDTIRRADHVLDLGPGAGVRGGRAGRRRHGEGPDRAIRARSPGASCAHRCCTRRSRCAPSTPPPPC